MADNKIRKIFLVDDDDNHTQMLRTQIENKYKLEVITFNSGEDCIKNLHLNPSFIILDFYLDRVKKDAQNGIEILKQIKMISPDVFVIMLSGQDKIEVAVDTMKYGAYDYVIKNASGFLRVENILKNIYSNINLKRKASVYKTATIVLSSAIILIIILAIILVKTGVASNSPSWF